MRATNPAPSISNSRASTLRLAILSGATFSLSQPGIGVLRRQAERMLGGADLLRRLGIRARLPASRSVANPRCLGNAADLIRLHPLPSQVVLAPSVLQPELLAPSFKAILRNKLWDFSKLLAWKVRAGGSGRQTSTPHVFCNQSSCRPSRRLPRLALCPLIRSWCPTSDCCFSTPT